MSDSDETVCGDESADENTENSPSLLSNWHPEKNIFSAEKVEENLTKNSSNIHEETSSGVDRMIESREPEISPEFPLIPRGLKRKDGYDETDEKDVQRFTNSAEIPVLSSTESENIFCASAMDTRTTGDEIRLERLLKNVEDFVKDMELSSELEDAASNLGGLQNAKSQLEDVQKLLGETNRKNQAERRMILSGVENSQQLPEEKKLIIVNLAKRQRNLLEAFKKYKSLVQRLKTMKGLNGTSKRSVHQDSVITSTQYNQNRSSISLPSTRSAQSPNKSVEHSSQSFQNPSTFTWQGGALTPSLKHHSDRSIQLLSHLRPQNVSTPFNASVSTAPRIIMTNATNPALTKAIQQQSVKFMVLQNHSQNSSQAFPKAQLNPLNSKTIGADTASVVSGFGQTAVTQSVLQAVPTHLKKMLINNTTASKQPAVSINESLPQNQITVCKVGSQSTEALATCVNSSSMIQRAQHSSIFHPTTQTLIPPNRPTISQVSLPQTLSQTITVNSHFSTNKQDQPATSRLSSNQVQTIGVPITSFPHSKTYQTTAIRPSHAPHLELSLETLVKKGKLVPGKNVLTTKSEGKLYSASLSEKGTIISAGGEGFTSPRSWVKAILGSKRKVKNELAWKMVSYKNKPLLDHASTIAPEPETSVSFGVELGQIQDTTSRSDTRRELITTTHALKALLSNCRVIGITKKEVLSLEKTKKEFWDDADTELVDDDILKALDF